MSLGSEVALGSCLTRVSASSTIGEYLMVFPGSIPAEQVIITFGKQSSILLASSLAAKPPKTTEWMAPILAQANIAKAAYGTIGM